MTKAPVFPDELVYKCLYAQNDAGKEAIVAILTTAHSMGYASEVPWWETAQTELQKIGHEYKATAECDKAALVLRTHFGNAPTTPPSPVEPSKQVRDYEDTPNVADVLREEFFNKPTASPSPVEPDGLPQVVHTCSEHSWEGRCMICGKRPTAPEADAVTRAEFNHLFHSVVALANGRTDDAFDKLDVCAKMKPGKTLRETPNEESEVVVDQFAPGEYPHKKRLLRITWPRTCVDCGQVLERNAPSVGGDRIDALEATLSRVEQERDALRLALETVCYQCDCVFAHEAEMGTAIRNVARAALSQLDGEKKK